VGTQARLSAREILLDRVAMNTSSDRTAVALVGEENLALRPGVRVMVSVMQPTGGGARNPHVLLNDDAHQLDGCPLTDYLASRCFDTYDGQNQAVGPDWYMVEFPAPCTFNCIEMTMGLAFRDGGWWTSLNVEYLRDGVWSPVTNQGITPNYDFADGRLERRPFETFVFTFDAVTSPAVRIIGMAGGVAQFSALARLAVFLRDRTQWNPTMRPATPTPFVFQLIPPSVMWDISESFVRLTGVLVEFPMVEYYLDGARYQQLWQRLERNYRGEPDLWFLVGDTVGWGIWNQHTVRWQVSRSAEVPDVLRWLNNTMGAAMAPLVVQGEVLGAIYTQVVLLRDRFDLAWHRTYAAEQGIAWDCYQRAIERTPQLPEAQLEGAAALLGMIANTIANLAVHNRHLERELDHARRALRERSALRRQLVSHAVDFMQHNLEMPIKIADVAGAIGLSPSYFGALFMEETGRTPVGYLAELRIERAKEYLRHTQFSIGDICARLGYDPSYFSRLFKRRMGCTPGEYAAQIRSRDSA
jgi:AraC-like DNA-binding protein